MEVYLHYLDYEKISDYVNYAISQYKELVKTIGDYNYNSHYTNRQLIDMRSTDYPWFDEYFFFKYDGMISYMSLFKGVYKYETSELFLNLVSTYNYILSDCEILFDNIPSTSFKVEMDDDSDYFDEDYVLAYGTSVNALKRYLMKDITRMEKKCEVEFDMTGDIYVYNDLFIALYALSHLLEYVDIDSDPQHYIGYSERSYKTTIRLEDYFKEKRNKLTKKLDDYLFENHCDSILFH